MYVERYGTMLLLFLTVGLVALNTSLIKKLSDEGATCKNRRRRLPSEDVKRKTEKLFIILGFIVFFNFNVSPQTHSKRTEADGLEVRPRA